MRRPLGPWVEEYNHQPAPEGRTGEKPSHFFAVWTSPKDQSDPRWELCQSRNFSGWDGWKFL